MRKRILPLILAVLAAAPAATAQDVAGCWAGSVGTGPGERRAVLELKGGTGDVSGMLHVLGRRIASDTLRDFRLSANAITFSVPADSGSPRQYRGSLEQDSGRIAGSISGDTTTSSFSFSRVPAQPHPLLSLVGYWSGGLYQGSALALRMGLEAIPAPCGQVLVMLDSPDQNVDNMPVTSVRMTGDSLFIELTYLSGSFRGKVEPGATAMAGDWLQGGGRLTLKLERSDSAVSFVRPQEPKPPFPYTVEEVTYQNTKDGTRFAGTLTIPQGEGPFPAVVLITGSGAQNRDEAIMGHKPFHVIADHLSRNGIAVLRSDDRGVGGSTGDVMSATIADNVGDVMAAVELLETRARLDSTKIGLVGHSEGGWVGPLVATRTDDVAFVVMLAGPAVSGEEILYAQTRLISKVSGAPDVLLDASEAVARRMYAILKSEPDSAKARAAIMALSDTAERFLPPDQAAALDSAGNVPNAREQFEQSIGLLLTPWFRFLLTYDPAPALDALRIPVLALFGQKDLQVPPEQSVPVLRRLWADHPDATIHVFPSLNHLFQPAETGAIAEYGTIEQTISPEVLAMMTNWIKQRTAPR